MLAGRCGLIFSLRSWFNGVLMCMRRRMIFCLVVAGESLYVSIIISGCISFHCMNVL